MSFIQTVAYGESDAAIFLNNYKIGLVRSVKELAKTEFYPHRVFGECAPISTAAGNKSYEIVITREQSDDAVDFSAFDSFTLRVKKHTVLRYTAAAAAKALRPSEKPASRWSRSLRCLRRAERKSEYGRRKPYKRAIFRRQHSMRGYNTAFGASTGHVGAIGILRP